jgi:hypothetical protein
MLAAHAPRFAQIETEFLAEVDEYDRKPNAAQGLFSGKKLPGFIQAGVNALKKIISLVGTQMPQGQVPGVNIDITTLTTWLTGLTALIPNPFLKMVVQLAVQYLLQHFSAAEIGQILQG